MRRYALKNETRAKGEIGLSGRGKKRFWHAGRRTTDVGWWLGKKTEPLVGRWVALASGSAARGMRVGGARVWNNIPYPETPNIYRGHFNYLIILKFI
jgi:hypothetical protein